LLTSSLSPSGESSPSNFAQGLEWCSYLWRPSLSM
jgi:hypothetical protein